MKFLLIFYYLSNGGFAMPVAVYDDKAACTSAGAEARAELSRNAWVACVPVPSDMPQVRHGGVAR